MGQTSFWYRWASVAVKAARRSRNSSGSVSSAPSPKVKTQLRTLSGETVRAVFLHQPPAAGGVKKNCDLIFCREDALRRQIRRRSRAGREGLTGDKVCHPVELEQPEILPGLAPAPDVPGGPLEHQVIGLDGPHRRFSGRKISKPDGQMLPDG